MYSAPKSCTNAFAIVVLPVPGVGEQSNRLGMSPGLYYVVKILRKFFW